MPGDIILQVDGNDTKGKASDDVSKILKGQPGTDVKVTVLRPGEKTPITKTITRQEIKISSVPYYGMVTNDIGYIRLTQFTEDCGTQVADALKDLESKHQLKGVVFDLRNNPGGLLK